MRTIKRHFYKCIKKSVQAYFNLKYRVIVFTKRQLMWYNYFYTLVDKYPIDDHNLYTIEFYGNMLQITSINVHFEPNRTLIYHLK